MRHSGRSIILSRRRYFSFASLSLALHMEQAQSRKPALFLSEIVRISLNLQRPLRRGDDVIRNPFPLGMGLCRFQRGQPQTGRASCREKVCTYWSLMVVGVDITTKH